MAIMGVEIIIMSTTTINYFKLLQFEITMIEVFD